MGDRQQTSARTLVRVAVGAVAVTAITILVALTPARSSGRIHFRSCGHAEDRWDKLARITGGRLRFGATDCCSSSSMINDLRRIEAAQAVYQMDHGGYASSLNQLTNDLVVLPKFEFHFISDGTNWSVSVPQQGLFAGNYLLTPDHLYFNPTASPSVNDVDLWSRK